MRDRIRRELRELIPVTLFFVIAFQLLALTQSLLLHKYGIRTTAFFAALVAALVVAKVVLIADHLPWVNRFPDHPLIYNVLWKTAIYFTASIAVRYGEHLFRFWRQSPDLATANRRLIAEIVWPHFWCVQMWMLILLFVYGALRELIRVLGRERIMHMFFRAPAKDLYGGGVASEHP